MPVHVTKLDFDNLYDLLEFLKSSFAETNSYPEFYFALIIPFNFIMARNTRSARQFQEELANLSPIK